MTPHYVRGGAVDKNKFIVWKEGDSQKMDWSVGDLMFYRFSL